MPDDDHASSTDDLDHASSTDDLDFDLDPLGEQPAYSR
jgi:hypothetical protein